MKVSTRDRRRLGRIGIAVPVVVGLALGQPWGSALSGAALVLLVLLVLSGILVDDDASWRRVALVAVVPLVSFGAITLMR